MALFEEEAIQIITPLANLWNGFVEVFPGIIAAIIILIIGYLVSLLLGYVVKVVLSKLKVDKVLEKIKAPEAISKLRISSIFGQLTKWYIFLIFFGSAVDVLNLGVLSSLMERFALWLPQLIIAILSVFVGLVVAYYVGHLIKEEAAIKGAETAAKLFEYVIIFIAVVIALEQIGIEVSILENTFLILVAAFGFGCALAIGLSFGLGMKAQAAKYFEKAKKKL